MLPIVVPLLTLGAAGYLARHRTSARSVENASSSHHEPSPLTVLGAFLYVGEAPPLGVVVAAIAHAESSGHIALASDLAELFLPPVDESAHDGHESDPRVRGVAVASGASAPMPKRVMGNSAAAVAAAVGATRSGTSSAVAAPTATWPRAYAPERPAETPAATRANSGSSAVAASSLAASPAIPDSASVAAASWPLVSVTAVTPQTAEDVGAEIDAEAQRVLEMLAMPESRAAKVELLSGAAGPARPAPELDVEPELDVGLHRHAPTVELLPRPGDAAAVLRTAPLAELDIEAQRVLEELATLDRHAAKVELLTSVRALDEPVDPDDHTVKVELLSAPGATRDPEVMLATSSPIDGVAPAAWLMFVGQVSREAPSFVGAHHVGRFRQRRDRLAELGIDPAKVIGSPEAQHAALDVDMLDAYKHACSSGLVDEYLGTKVELHAAGSDARRAEVTLSGVLGVIQAAGLEGAVQWLEQPGDRLRFPNTTQAFLRTNGVF